MRLRSMRFVLEEDNALILRDKDGIEIQRQDNIIPEGHSLVLASEDLSYITYGCKAFSYKRYNPESLAIEEEYGIPTGGSQSEYENFLPLAAYCPTTKKAFFITISKTTREIWIYENDNSEPKRVDENLPSRRWNTSIDLRKDVSLHSSYFGEGLKKYTISLSGEDCSGYWQFAIDISKNGSIAPKIVSFGGNEKVNRNRTGNPFLFGEGINPSSISCGRGGHVHISTPVDEDEMELKNDSFWRYNLKYSASTIVIFFSILFISGLLMANIIFSVLPELWIDSYVDSVNYLGEIDCEDCDPFTEQESMYLTSIFITGVLSISVSFIIPRKFERRIDFLMGNGIHRGSKREKSSYNSKLRKFSNLLDFYQISPYKIALLLPNKIQFYNFRKHQILEEETLLGNFDEYLILKQRKSPNGLNALVVYRINHGSLYFKNSNLKELKVGPTNQYSITPKSDVSLKAVFYEYQNDAHLPLVLNTRVEIDHTTYPMRLTINHEGQDGGVVEFYKRLRESPQVWSNITSISNITELIDNQTNEKEIVFELDDEKTLVRKPQYFDHFSHVGDGSKHKRDEKFRLRKGNKEFAPNLETAIYLYGDSDLNTPVTVFKNTFSDNFPALMKMLWVGDGDTEIYQDKPQFKIEDDLPVLSLIHNKLSPEFKHWNPKQNTELWEKWKEHLPSGKLEAVLEIIELDCKWPRNGYMHQMMHGDLTPANVIVNACNEEYGDPRYTYDLFLCDFHDVVARGEDGSIIYRIENVDFDASSVRINSSLLINPPKEMKLSRVTSHFLNTQEPPQINPMLDLSRFFANLLLKIPYEPSRREGGLAAPKLKSRREARKVRAHQKASGDMFVKEQLDIALDWAQENLRDSCFLAEEGDEDSWRHLLKAMIFDQCLQIMMFWRRNRSGSAINNDMSADDLILAFYGDVLDNHKQSYWGKWSQEVVNLDLLGWKSEIDPYDTTVGAYDASENSLPEILDKVIEEGFPAKTFRRWPKERDTFGRGWFDFRFELDEIMWSCMCYIEDDILIVKNIATDEDWTDWP